jgi:hypothetical protein
MVLALLNRLGLNEVGLRDIRLGAMTTARGGCYEYLCNFYLICAGFTSPQLPLFQTYLHHSSFLRVGRDELYSKPIHSSLLFPLTEQNAIYSCLV